MEEAGGERATHGNTRAGSWDKSDRTGLSPLQCHTVGEGAGTVLVPLSARVETRGECERSGGEGVVGEEGGGGLSGTACSQGHATAGRRLSSTLCVIASPGHHRVNN